MRYWRTYLLSASLGFVLCLAETSQFAGAEEPLGQVAGTTQSSGPDVIVSNLAFSNIISHAYENTLTGIITGFSIGTSSCNIGNVPVVWQQSPSVQHPVIRSSMFRLKDNRFEQIGMSWVKHGFFAVNDATCNSNCTAPGNHGGTALYPGCGDPYDASLNGNRPYLGASSQINAHTGAFSNPIIRPTNTGQNGRLQVHNVDLNPAFNANARYYVSGQYITADDAAAGNGNNNASYQRVVVVSAPTFPEDSCTGSDPQRYCAYYTDFLRDQEAPIRAWKNEDPGVVETDAQVPGEGLFILAARTTDLGTGYWRYEYALQNLNSDRSGKAFTVPIAIGASVTNVGFHDVEYHSGETFVTGQTFLNLDWESAVLAGKIIWTTEDYDANPNANALRWGTIYNFRFDSTAPPGYTTVVLDLFKPGAPNKININTVGPIVGFIDCNENGIADACDVDCGGVGCSPPCGTFDDCNNNTVPDECESDCNDNGIADTCDLIPQGTSEDCNENTVPDECEEDCNLNGIPDNCEDILDADGDGINDCDDLCPTTTPPGGCTPPDFVGCLSESGVCAEYQPYSTCLALGSTPLCSLELPGSCWDCPTDCPPRCPTSFCRSGCMVGDSDGDGDFDLADFDELIQCFTGEEGSAAFIEPSLECRIQFDFDDNGAIDLADVEQFRRELDGPGGI